MAYSKQRKFSETVQNPATFTFPIALPLACQGCAELNISMTSQVNGQDKNCHVSGYEANHFNPQIQWHPSKSIWRKYFLLYKIFKVYVIWCKLNTRALTEYVKYN